MEYHLQITEIVPLTDEQKEKRGNKNGYSSYPTGGIGNLYENDRRQVLDVVISADEWAKIKASVIEIKH